VRATGAGEEHVVAFARRGDDGTLLTIVPRLVTSLQQGRGSAVPDADAWDDTAVAGDDVRGRWRNLFTGAEHAAGDDGLSLAEVLGGFPVALLERI
jgi:maltooligosyltrehalose synthase